MHFVQRMTKRFALILAVTTMVMAPTLPVFADNQPTATSSNTTVATPLKQPAEQPKSATELAEQVRTGQTTSTALVNQTLSTIEQTNPQLNDVITVRKDAAQQ